MNKFVDIATIAILIIGAIILTYEIINVWTSLPV